MENVNVEVLNVGSILYFVNDDIIKNGDYYIHKFISASDNEWKLAISEGALPKTSRKKVIATNNIINNSVNNLLPQISLNQINTTKKQNFFELQKSLIETDLNKTFESRKNQLDQFRDSFLFNTKDKFNVFKEKYPEPTYKFTDSMGRTQVNNLNRDLSSSLATSVGFKKFEWLTSNDERVRESHRKLNGKIFDYDNLPSEYNDYNCRCDLLPVLESIED
jgi:SPP1 gp7 family putative phage head morphogenesis protein